MISRMREPTFFTLPAGDRWFLGLLVAIAAVAFTPWSRATEFGGLPLFAWFMTALMVLAPAIALLRLFGQRGPRG
jgi:CDP-diglyceride synthetase